MLKQDVLIKPRAAQYEQFCQTALSLLSEAGIKGGSIWVLDRPKLESSILQGLEGEHGFFLSLDTSLPKPLVLCFPR